MYTCRWPPQRSRYKTFPSLQKVPSCIFVWLLDVLWTFLKVKNLFIMICAWNLTPCIYKYEIFFERFQCTLAFPEMQLLCELRDNDTLFRILPEVSLFGKITSETASAPSVVAFEFPKNTLLYQSASVAGTFIVSLHESEIFHHVFYSVHVWIFTYWNIYDFITNCFHLLLVYIIGSFIYFSFMLVPLKLGV